MNQPIMTMTKYSQVWPAWMKSISWYDEIFPPASTKEEAMVIKHLKCKYNYTNANEKIYKYKYTEKQITILRWYDLPTQRPRKKQWWSRM